MTEETSALLLERLRHPDRGLTPVGEAIARAIIGDPARALTESIDVLAARAGVSSGSLVRFAREMGFSGYRAFKLGLAAEAHLATDTRVPGPESIFERAMAAQLSALAFAAKTVDGREFALAADLLVSARRVDVMGTGASGLIAGALAFQLSTLGCYCRQISDPGEAAAAAGFLATGDALFVVSHSGRTRHAVEAATRARQAGAAVIALTSAGRTALVRSATVALVIEAARTRYRAAEFPFRTAQLAVVQALALAVAERLGPAELGGRQSHWAEARFGLRMPGLAAAADLHNR